ncbi:MAG: hypothetical protein FWE67_11935, partial [Planctomycetaceae bacterium]|nr:hypothetical protein [Planctomycetaceae bacterium]
LQKHITHLSDYTLLDTSCGYGSFLRVPNSIGADCDTTALLEAEKNTECKLFLHNSLRNVSRKQYGLFVSDKIIIVGNPPYNDKTSLVKNSIKKETGTLVPEIDEDLKNRDLGISFLLSYNKLEADYICVLHPLSYLIKKTNFDRLRSFCRSYKLIDNLIISSSEFSAASKTTAFPIVIALYQRHIGKEKTDQEAGDLAPATQQWKTKDGKTFTIGQFDSVGNYITKYPNQRAVKQDETAAYFWTMRDINALKRSKTFVAKECSSTIRVTKELLSFYCYVDAFKDYIPHIPYYFGNSDIMINKERFVELQNIFLARACMKHSELINHTSAIEYSAQSEKLLDEYFHVLLGEHYVN